jgi:hypothetical protein
MAIKTLTLSQAARLATTQGRPTTPEEIKAAITRGELTTHPFVSRGLLEIDVLVWLDERAELLTDPRPRTTVRDSKSVVRRSSSGTSATQAGHLSDGVGVWTTTTADRSRFSLSSKHSTMSSLADRNYLTV